MKDEVDVPATSRERALVRLARLYDDLEQELARLRPKCELSGRCCNFRQSGHVLFATDLEIAHLERTTPLRRDGDPELCPWWEGGLCKARDGRPLGCRVYFCDESKAEPLAELSARYHDRLKRIHDGEAGEGGESDAIPYRYAPFVRRVREVAAARPAASAPLTGSPPRP
jgi:Fe-S-cluster containining protein